MYETRGVSEIFPIILIVFRFISLSFIYSSFSHSVKINCCVLLDVQCCLYCFETLWIQTLMVQVARRSASVLKRRKSRNRMEVPSADRNHEGPSPSAGSVNDVTPHTPNVVESQMSKESENEVIYYMDEPHAPG
jgi:hypothetical protein